MTPFLHVSRSFRRRNPDLFPNDIPPVVTLPHAIIERDQAPTLGRTTSRATPCVGRTHVRFVGYRVRPLDPDNHAGGCKDLLDGLRHAGLIPGDEPWRITFETEQVRVHHHEQEGTEIVIVYPKPMKPRKCLTTSHKESLPAANRLQDPQSPASHPCVQLPMSNLLRFAA